MIEAVLDKLGAGLCLLGGLAQSIDYSNHNCQSVDVFADDVAVTVAVPVRVSPTAI